MSNAAHEQAYTLWVDIPSDASAIYDNGAPLDAGMAMILASNEAHLCLESLRHHVTDVSARSLAKSSGKDTWENVQDVTGPSAADIAALPADEGYKGVSWMNFTAMWGPLLVPLDRVGDDGSLVLRRLKCQFTFSNSGGSAAYAHVVLTTHNSPPDIGQGNVSAYTKLTITGSGTVVADATLDADVRDAVRENLAARRGSTTAGTAYFVCIPVYVWLCVDSTVTSLLVASIWESRT